MSVNARGTTPLAPKPVSNRQKMNWFADPAVAMRPISMMNATIEMRMILLRPKRSASNPKKSVESPYWDTVCRDRQTNELL
jgi:hypothetical protein